MSGGEQAVETADTPVSVYDLIRRDEQLVYCSWCGAEPSSPCTEWDEPIETFHDQRVAHLLDLRVALVAPALKDAGAWVSQQRRGTGERKYANAAMFGEAIWARGADIEFRSEQQAKRIRFALTTPPGQADPS